jgi:hypothetical protein
MSKISLEDFERLVAERDTEKAYAAALSILGRIDRVFGRIDNVPMRAAAMPGDETTRLTRFSTRFCAAFGQLVCDRSLQPTGRTLAQIMLFHRWIDLMFASSGFRTPDNFLRLLGTGEGDEWRLTDDDMIRFLLLYSPRAEFNIDFERIMRVNPHMAIIAFLNFLGTRYCFTDRAHQFRERLLEWLPGKLDAVTLGPIILRNAAEPFMHCSYAFSSHKHDIKEGLIRQLHRACIEAGAKEAAAPPEMIDGKPVVVVTTEHFTKGHSVYRTHSRSVRSLKEKFHVVGLLPKRARGEEVDSCFDECITYPDGEFFGAVREISQIILARKPALIYHLGVGMSDHVIALSSLRLAPVQICSFGHTATTRSPVIDYMVLPDDFMGSPDCFSEKMVLLPPHAMPYTPVDKIDIDAIIKKVEPERMKSGVIKAGVAASIMKLNAPFFAALDAAAKAAKNTVEFHFFPLAGVGLAHAELTRVLKTKLPSAVVHTEQPYQQYMEALASCEFCISPFPYGNMNSIIDAARLGVPGVCLDGPEAHSHADVGYFARLGLPPELSAKTVEDYSAVITRLIDDAKFRKKCRDAAAASDLDKGFFEGDESLFCDAIAKLVKAA